MKVLEPRYKQIQYAILNTNSAFKSPIEIAVENEELERGKHCK